MSLMLGKTISSTCKTSDVRYITLSYQGSSCSSAQVELLGCLGFYGAVAPPRSSLLGSKLLLMKKANCSPFLSKLLVFRSVGCYTQRISAVNLDCMSRHMRRPGGPSLERIFAGYSPQRWPPPKSGANCSRDLEQFARAVCSSNLLGGAEQFAFSLINWQCINGKANCSPSEQTARAV